MHHLSRRFSSFVFLYVAIASIVTQTAYVVTMWFPLAFDGLNYTLFRLVSMLVIFTPPLIVIAARKYPFARVLRLNAFPAKYAGYAIGLGACLFLFCRLLFALNESALELLLYGDVLDMWRIIFANSFHSIWPYILTSCLIPALLEVTVYQGAVYSGLHAVKPLKACLLVGLLQGLVVVGSNAAIGASVSTIISYSFFGFALCYIALQSGSILPAIIASFVYYLCSYADLEDLLYQYVLSPLGVGQIAAAVGLMVIAGGLGLLLMLKLPRVQAEGRPLRRLSFKEFREKLTQPYIPDPKDEMSEAERSLQESVVPEENEPSKAAVPETAELTEAATDDPGDTAKNKNVGFIVGGALLAALTLASQIYGIITIIIDYINFNY